MLFLRRKETPWEVVDSRFVAPVPMYYEDEDLDIEVVGDVDTRGTYVFETSHLKRDIDTQRAVAFARQQLMERITKKGYNALLLESWQLTLYRRDKQHRVKVQYTGRPVRVLGQPPDRKSPPFLATLRHCDLLYHM